jgi:hypothetical protein
MNLKLRGLYDAGRGESREIGRHDKRRFHRRGAEYAEEEKRKPAP